MLLRLIPVLLLSGEGLVKTERFKNPKYVGDPRNAIRIFNEKEVDELIILDIDATKKSKPPNYKLISEITSECFMPLGYGGGINSIEMMAKLYELGIEKLIINNATLNNPKLISEAVKLFGSQSIVASIDIKYSIFKKPIVYTLSGTKIISKNLTKWIDNLTNLGVGELIIYSIDRDGCRNGLDLKLINELKFKTQLPIVYCGGVGEFNDIIQGYKYGATAIGAGSYFVFHGRHKAVLINYPKKEEISKICNII